jgi:ketosteroid isomerase-like protein
MNTQNRMIEPEYAQKIALIEAYSAAKSRQDINAALALCSEDFSLYADAFGTTAHGQRNVRKQLEVFFDIFPDFNAQLNGFGANDYGAMCWATCQMTMACRLGKLSQSRG